VTCLLDVNVLIALIDSSHEAHSAAHEWFAAHGRAAWATSPLTENGLVRIISHPRYPNPVDSTAVAVDLLRGLRRHPGHRFWADDLSLADGGVVDAVRPVSSGQLTDAYLLALAAKNDGVLVTFDRRVAGIVGAESGGSLVILSRYS
jgi:toxin-antitoxin system PIN domain toxin